MIAMLLKTAVGLIFIFHLFFVLYSVAYQGKGEFRVLKPLSYQKIRIILEFFRNFLDFLSFKFFLIFLSFRIF